VSTGGGGGGSQSDLPWRDKDDDDLQWARRCARAATLLLGKKPRTGLRR
jgi:dihydrofolate reductase